MAHAQNADTTNASTNVTSHSGRPVESDVPASQREVAVYKPTAADAVALIHGAMYVELPAPTPQRIRALSLLDHESGEDIPLSPAHTDQILLRPKTNRRHLAALGLAVGIGSILLGIGATLALLPTPKTISATAQWSAAGVDDQGLHITIGTGKTASVATLKPGDTMPDDSVLLSIDPQSQSYTTSKSAAAATRDPSQAQPLAASQKVKEPDAPTMGASTADK